MIQGRGDEKEQSKGAIPTTLSDLQTPPKLTHRAWYLSSPSWVGFRDAWSTVARGKEAPGNRFAFLFPFVKVEFSAL
jgi:hypothetical protein